MDFSDHIELDAEVIGVGGVICSYFSSKDTPSIPYWKLGFADAAIRLLGSDDFPAAVKAQAAADLTAAIGDGALKSRIVERVPLEDIARAHDVVERGAGGRVVLTI